jgi:hypothetical protein
MKRIAVPLAVTVATTGILFGMVAFHANAAATPKGPHFPTTSALQPRQATTWVPSSQRVPPRWHEALGGPTTGPSPKRTDRQASTR